MRIRRDRYLKIGAFFILLTTILIAGCLSVDTSDKGPYSNPSLIEDSIHSGGLERSYLINVPSSYEGDNSMALVIALHGSGGTGRDMVMLTLGGLNRLSEEEGFIIVYPDAIGRHWNSGRDDVAYNPSIKDVDDVAFISDLIDHIASEYNTSEGRVYVTGMSNGGFMSHRLACEIPEKITAIAPVVGGMREEYVTDNTSLKPLPVLIINYVDDPIVPWEGREIRLGRRSLGNVSSVNQTVNYWVLRNNCSEEKVEIVWTVSTSEGSVLYKVVHYSNCSDCSDVVLYAIEEGGHTWPGGYQRRTESTTGEGELGLDANEVIWNFFRNKSSGDV